MSPDCANIPTCAHANEAGRVVAGCALFSIVCIYRCTAVKIFTRHDLSQISVHQHARIAMRAVIKQRICWLVPSDRGGGVMWVADSCCRQAFAAGYDVTLLTMEPFSQSTMSGISYPVKSMDVVFPYADTPAKFVNWAVERRPHVIFLNDCDAMNDCITYLPPEVRCVYVVHDTMSFYWKSAVRHEASLDAIVAVSGEVARRFRHKLKRSDKLHVIQNGTVFPPLQDAALERERDALVFLGGDDPCKGAYDVLEVWRRLVARDFGGWLHWYGRLQG
jgi:hypothetical protein